MFRIVRFVIIFFFVVTEAQAVGEAPRDLIDGLDQTLSNIRKETVDSLKTDLSNRYVRDFRTYGRTAAYDSLRARINVINASNEHNQSDSLVISNNVEQPLSEIDRLKKEVQTLKNEIAQMKKVQSGVKEPELTYQQKRARWIVKKLMMDNAALTDSMTRQNRDTTFGQVPLVFDSASREAYLPIALLPPHRDKYLLSASKSAPGPLDHFEQLYQSEKMKRIVREQMLLQVIDRNPAAVDYYMLPEYVDELPELIKNAEKPTLLDVKGVDVNSFVINKPTLQKRADDPWSTTGKFAMQFSQYYVTDNWYKGGEPNATLLGIFYLERNYKKDKKIWDNSLDVKLGFYTTQNDTIRAFRVNNDVFELTSTLGYQSMFAKWFYAAYGELNTQMFRNYKATNSNVIKASFLSPTRIFLSLGAKYEYNTNVYAYLSPLAYKLLFLVNNDIEDPKTVGIEHGKVQNDFGFFGKGKLKWKFSNDVNLESSFDIFSPYSFENVELDWETVGNFVINRYLSTRLSLNLRYDSTPMSTDYDSPKLQIQEQLSFGFNYVF